MLLDITGWLGVIFCTTGYLLLSLKLITAEHLLFQLLNIVGGLCLVTIALFSNDMPNVVANLLWMFVGLFAIARQLQSRRKHRRN
jgi:lipid-A-disaccharide synthase-like uncharacterized protein